MVSTHQSSTVSLPPSICLQIFLKKRFHCNELQGIGSEFQSEESGAGIGCNQFDAAATLFHYLARDAQTDAAAGGFGGEEGYEYLLCLIGGDGFAVVADVDEDGVVGSGVGRYGYGCSSSFDGVLQQIGDDMSYEAFIGIEEKVGYGDVKVDVRVFRILRTYRYHPFKEWFYIEEFWLGGGNERHAAVVIHEVEKLFACGVDNR